MARCAEPDDVDAICGMLPETWFGTTLGDVPTGLVGVRAAGKGYGFVLRRKPHKTAVDPATGEPFDDLLVTRTPSAAEKAALVEPEGPCFTTDHFKSYNADLIQESKLHRPLSG